MSGIYDLTYNETQSALWTAIIPEMKGARIISRCRSRGSGSHFVTRARQSLSSQGTARTQLVTPPPACGPQCPAIVQISVSEGPHFRSKTTSERSLPMAVGARQPGPAAPTASSSQGRWPLLCAPGTIRSLVSLSFDRLASSPPDPAAHLHVSF